MRNPRLATRYAKSILDLAIEQNVLEPVLSDMELILNTFAKSRELTVILRSPVIGVEKKNAILAAIFEGKIQHITKLFIELLVKKNREFFLPEMAEAFITQYKVYKNIHVVRLTTAVAINDTLKEELERKIASSLTDGSIDMETRVNADLIGGFVLEVGDKLFDASILRDLNDIKKQFTKNEYIPLI